MRISDTISPEDITFDYWTDDDTAELGIRQNDELKAHWKPVYENYVREHPRSEPDSRYVFVEYWADKDKVVYWLDLDTDTRLVTEEIGCKRLDDMVRSIVAANR